MTISTLYELLSVARQQVTSFYLDTAIRRGSKFSIIRPNQDRLDWIVTIPRIKGLHRFWLPKILLVCDSKAYPTCFFIGDSKAVHQKFLISAIQQVKTFTLWHSDKTLNTMDSFCHTHQDSLVFLSSVTNVMLGPEEGRRMIICLPPDQEINNTDIGDIKLIQDNGICMISLYL